MRSATASGGNSSARRSPRATRRRTRAAAGRPRRSGALAPEVPEKIEPYVRARLGARPLLVMAHVVVGYPSLAANREMLTAMDAAGVDLVELQLPFSEPIADGPVFVHANQEAIRSGTSWKDCFELVAWAAQRVRFPLLFMGYYNSVLQMGEERFARRLAEAGGRGYIVADLPPEEAGTLNRSGRAAGLDPILIMTPTN